jgi:hypothetical protein
MAKEHGPKWNVEDLTNKEIYDVIRYLETELTTANQRNNDTAFVICFCVVILLLGSLGFMSFYYRY